VKHEHSGSCHCGAVRFRAATDLEAGTVRCNCSICSKGRFWLAVVSPQDFHLDKGADALSTYSIGSGNFEHHFCSRCGIKPFVHGRQGPTGEFYAVSLASLDGVDPQTLAAAPVMFMDGAADAFDRPPAVTGHL
jgi:hypothetical protein